MITNVNLPTVFTFHTAFSAEGFAQRLGVIVPKIKFEYIEGDNYVFYTRKDKNYRELLKTFSGEEIPNTTPLLDALAATVNTEAQ